MNHKNTNMSKEARRVAKNLVNALQLNGVPLILVIPILFLIAVGLCVETALSDKAAKICCCILILIKLLAMYWPIPCLDFSWYIAFAPFLIKVVYDILCMILKITIGVIVGITQDFKNDK